MSEVTQILDLNRFDPQAAGPSDPRLAHALERRRATAGASSVLFYRAPLEVVRGEGTWLYAADGRRYLDVYNNVPSVGHCHPHVVEAIARQSAMLSTHTRYLGQVVDTYAERLLGTFPDGLDNLVMTCTGTESNDMALRIASAVTGADGVVVTRTAYHGNSTAVSAISPSSAVGKPLASHVRVIDLPANTPEAGHVFARALMAAIADLQAAGHGISALIADTIFSSDGVFADPPGFLAEAVDAVRAAGGLFIADEVQPGFGRTGRMWGFARHGVVPDIVTMGKPMGNGYPMGGVVTRPELLARFCEENGYFNTFGGNTVAAAAGMAVLEVIAEEGLVENAGTVGDHLRAGLCDLAGRHDRIAEIRGAGLFTGLDLVDPQSGVPDAAATVAAINGLKEEGVLIGAAGLNGNTLKIRPPLCFGVTEADLFVETLDRVLRRAGT